MLIDINEIIVNDRIRKDFGNLEELAEDIKKNGLINPLTVNGDYKLLAGERRLRACKLLGWNQVDVRVVKSNDEAHDLAVEMSENNLRRNFTGSELAEGIRRQMALESEKAKERQGERTDLVETFPQGSGGKARDKAGAAFGISGKQAEKVMFVDDHKDLLDPADFADWDEGRLSTNKAFQRVKAAMAQAEKERDEARKDAEELVTDNESLQNEIAELEAKLEKQADEAFEEGFKAAEEQQRYESASVKEVVREAVPEDVQKRIRDLEHLERIHCEDNQRLRDQLRDARKELDRAKGIIGMDKGTRDVQRDVEYLISATNQYVRHYGGLTWTFERIADVDDVTRDELRKAVKNLATFSSALVAGLEQM